MNVIYAIQNYASRLGCKCREKRLSNADQGERVVSDISRNGSAGPPRGEVARLPSGYELHYHDIAGRDAGANPAVVLVQGSGPGANGYSNFKFNQEVIARAGFRVIVPDLLGFGYSSKPEGLDYTLGLFSGTLCELLDHLAIDRCVLIGNSLGGAVSIDIALKRPRQVEKLVLMAPGGIETTATYFAMPGIQRMVSEFVGGARDRQALRKILQMLAYDSRHVDDALVEERFAILGTQPKEVLARMKIPDLTARLPELQMPILGFWGMDDQFCPASGAQKVLAACADARFVLYARTGHWVMIERAREFNAIVIDFLTNRAKES